MMPLLPRNEIESELSYAYLHSVAAKAGMGCFVMDRHADKLGIDAAITACENFGPAATLTDVTLHIQLKATIAEPTVRNGKLPYAMQGINRYDKLRRETVMPPRLLVVLFLPPDANQWLRWSENQLSLLKCAWWVSLRGAPDTTNSSSVTVYLPQEQALSPDALHGIMTRLAHEEELTYAG